MAEDGRWRRRVTEEAAKEAGRGGEVRQVAMVEREDSHAADCVWLLQSAPWPLAPDPWPHRLCVWLLTEAAASHRSLWGQGPGARDGFGAYEQPVNKAAPGPWRLAPAPCPLPPAHWP